MNTPDPAPDPAQRKRNLAVAWAVVIGLTALAFCCGAVSATVTIFTTQH